ncbi:MAG TPA: peptidoglycan-binding domain-containing protein, partial [Burkholderiales bacterium]|nr:peptidoglycan-binding domain-containing protein [Burkholderiales bacterium]
GFIGRVQERLRALGFDAGPVNGDFGEKTQAALAQFQLSRAIPASGQLDEQTLAELGVTREESGS